MKVTDDDNVEHAVGRHDVRPAEGEGTGDRARLLRRRRQGAVRRRRLVRHGRRRPYRSEWLHADHRPRQGRDQVRRRMDLDHRSREPRGRPSRRRGSGGDRGAAFQMGRAAVAGRRAEARQGAGESRHPGLHGRQGGEVVDARRRRVRRRDPAHRHRQDPEDRRCGNSSRAIACRPIDAGASTALGKGSKKRRRSGTLQRQDMAYYPERRVSKAAVWSRRLAVFSAVLFVVGGDRASARPAGNAGLPCGAWRCRGAGRAALFCLAAEAFRGSGTTAMSAAATLPSPSWLRCGGARALRAARSTAAYAIRSSPTFRPTSTIRRHLSAAAKARTGGHERNPAVHGRSRRGCSWTSIRW